MVELSKRLEITLPANKKRRDPSQSRGVLLLSKCSSNSIGY